MSEERYYPERTEYWEKELKEFTKRARNERWNRNKGVGLSIATLALSLVCAAVASLGEIDPQSEYGVMAAREAVESEIVLQQKAQRDSLVDKFIEARNSGKVSEEGFRLSDAGNATDFDIKKIESRIEQGLQHEKFKVGLMFSLAAVFGLVMSGLFANEARKCGRGLKYAQYGIEGCKRELEDLQKSHNRQHEPKMS